MERQSEPLTTRDLAGTPDERRPEDDATALPPRDDEAARDPLDEPAATSADTAEPRRDDGPFDLDADRGRDLDEPRDTAATPTGEGRAGSEWSGDAAGGAGAATAEPDTTTRGEATTEPGIGAPAPAEPAAGGTTGSAAPAAGRGGGDPTAETTELLPEAERGDLQRQWEGIQTGFVDEPRQTVEQADALVATVMQRLAEGFAQERDRLEQQWGRGEDISTEDLRVALQRYRSFFQRLLSA
jgi:hypothetical protein